METGSDGRRRRGERRRALLRARAKDKLFDLRKVAEDRLLGARKQMSPAEDDGAAGARAGADKDHTLARSFEEQRKRAAQGQQATEELKLAVLEAALEPIITIDETGRIIDFNSAAEKIFGYAREEVMEQLASDFIVPSSLRDQYAKTLARLSVAGQPSIVGRTIETTGMRADGSEFPVEVAISRLELSGRILFTAYLRDVTERNQAQASLAHLASLVRSSHDAIIGETLDGVITSWNSGAERIYGYTEAEAVGRHMRLLAPPDQEAPESALVLEDGKGPGHHETIAVTKQGRRVHVSVITFPVTDRSGIVTGKATIARDVTSVKAAAVKRAELEQQLAQSQKMEAVGRLAGGIAHDFNNLLAVIINYTNFIAADIDDSSPICDDIARIQQAGNSAVGLVRQLLLFSRQEAVEPQVVDPNQLVLGMEKLLRRTIGEDIRLETRLATDAALIKIDPGQMEQILMNLAVNTRDAMPQGGTLSIDTSNTRADEYFAQQHEVDQGDYVRLAVSDNGAGMSEEVLAHIFEPFFTTKSEQEGTGLGLATVYAIVRQAEGCITVRSEPGVGTTFSIYLPATQEEERGDDDQRLRAPRRGNGETILVVEDEDGVRELAERILSAHGYEVLSAQSGREALELCGDRKGPLHLLLSDVIMPHMSGQELVRWLRQTNEGFATVFMSGYTEQHLGPHQLEDAGVSFLQKPFTADILLNRVQDALERRASGREMTV